MRGLWSRLVASLARKRLDAEMDRDIRLHLEMATEENVGRGMTREEAERVARRSFGGVEQIREELREGRGIRWVDVLGRDVRHAFRSLIRTPAFTGVAVVILAITLGTGTSAISVVDGVLLHALPYERPEDLVAVGVIERTDNGIDERDNDVPFELLEALQLQLRGVRLAGMFFGGTPALVGDGPFEDVELAAVAGDLFGVLGVDPAIGRLDGLDEFLADGSAPAVISYGFWQERYGGASAVVGSRIQLEGQPPMSIVGVLPASFRTVSRSGAPAPIWASVNTARAFRLRGDLGLAIGRIHDGETPDSVAAEMEVLSAGLARDDSPVRGVWFEPLHERMVGSSRPAVRIFATSVSLLLAVGILNLVAVQTSRLAGRRDELAIRAALGASRWTLMRAATVESLLLTLTGAGMGIAVLGASLQAVLRNLPDLVARPDNIRVGSAALAGAVLLALAAALVIGGVSSLRASRRIEVAIREGAPGLTGGPEQSRLLGLLTSVETALAVVLCVVAALLVQTQHRDAARYGGYDPGNVMSAQVDLPPGYGDPAYRIAFVERVLADLRLLPGVWAVSMSSTRLTAGLGAERVETEGRRNPFTVFSEVSAAYGDMLGFRPLEGRWFTEEEVSGNAPLVVVGESLAAALWPGENPIGRLLRRQSDTRWLSVIGVVPQGDASGFAVAPDVYVPYTADLSTDAYENLYFFVGSAAWGVAAGSRERIQEVEPNSRITLASMRSVLSAATRTSRFMAVISSALAATALLMALAGLYGVLAYRTARRTREIGLRMALGATREAVIRDVVQRALFAPVAGVAAGIYLSTVAVDFLRQTELFGSRIQLPTEPWAHAVAAFLSLALVVLALWLPARRAAGGDPLRALRHD